MSPTHEVSPDTNPDGTYIAMTGATQTDDAL